MPEPALFQLMTNCPGQVPYKLGIRRRVPALGGLKSCVVTALKLVRSVLTRTVVPALSLIHI